MKVGPTSLVPRCIYCEEELDLEEWVAKLDAGQAFGNWLSQAVPEARFVTTPICSRCKNDDERVESYLDAIGTEELRSRMRAANQRAINIAEQFGDTIK
jgi:hypothetical protein